MHGVRATDLIRARVKVPKCHPNSRNNGFTSCHMDAIGPCQEAPYLMPQTLLDYSKARPVRSFEIQFWAWRDEVRAAGDQAIFSSKNPALMSGLFR